MRANSKVNSNLKASTGAVKRSTGPKSIQGKAKSSKNAISHGLTGNQAMPDEIKMVEEFTQELTSYYKPESPLEVLQIQRIAFCRAKLAKLIDIEVAGREIKRREIELQPERVMEKLTQYSEKLRSLALVCVTSGSALTILGLDEVELNVIAQEIKSFAGMLEGESDLVLNFPRLCKYLSNVKPVTNQIENMGMDQALMIFAEKIRNLSINQELVAQTKSKMGPKETKFEEAMEQIHRSMQIDQMATRKSLRVKMPGVTGYHKAVEQDLREIIALANTLDGVPMVVQSFQEMKNWMLRAADLQSDESDRMMKYQTMLERRLSSAMGELLELRKYRIG